MNGHACKHFVQRLASSWANSKHTARFFFKSAPQSPRAAPEQGSKGKRFARRFPLADEMTLGRAILPLGILANSSFIVSDYHAQLLDACVARLKLRPTLAELRARAEFAKEQNSGQCPFSMSLIAR